MAARGTAAAVALARCLWHHLTIYCGVYGKVTIRANLGEVELVFIKCLINLLYTNIYTIRISETYYLVLTVPILDKHSN